MRGCALLEKGFASRSSPHPSSLLVHGTHTKVHFLHPPQLSSPICTPWGRCDPSGAQPQVGTHTSPPHPTPRARPRGVAAAAKALPALVQIKPKLLQSDLCPSGLLLSNLPVGWCWKTLLSETYKLSHILGSFRREIPEYGHGTDSLIFCNVMYNNPHWDAYLLEEI